MIGTPAGAKGMSTSVMTAASAAACARSPLAQIRDREREEERRERGVEAERVRIVEHAPDRRSGGRALRPKARRRRGRSRRESATRTSRAVPASAHDSSTIACDSTSRRSFPPGKIDATVTLIAT